MKINLNRAKTSKLMLDLLEPTPDHQKAKKKKTKVDRNLLGPIQLENLVLVA